jgi:hypothetical protein
LVFARFKDKHVNQLSNAGGLLVHQRERKTGEGVRKREEDMYREREERKRERKMEKWQ